MTAQQLSLIRLQEAIWHLEAAVAKLDGEQFDALSCELKAGIADVRAEMRSRGGVWEESDERP